MNPRGRTAKIDYIRNEIMFVIFKTMRALDVHFFRALVISRDRDERVHARQRKIRYSDYIMNN